ncbi:MAG: dihydropteroate synthase [Verrucomicrobiales bacterium]
MIWTCRDKTFDLTKRGEIMGILNVTPDSFSDGGQFVDVDQAVAHGIQMLDDGAGIIDIGGESTRPGADDVSEPDEIARVVPVIEKIIALRADAIISIDTSKAEVARKSIVAGAVIINDVTGLKGDPEMFAAAAELNAGVVIMHMKGTPRTMQSEPHYDDVVLEVREFFHAQLKSAQIAGISDSAIVFDLGIGFGKTSEHNLELLRKLKTLSVADRPLLLGVSRKSFIGKLIDSEKVADRNWPTVALTSYAREQGIRLHRVHEVKPNIEALRMTEAILG